MVYLGWMQYKLQKQQVCIQEYPVNQRLYSLAREIDSFIDSSLSLLLINYSKNSDNYFFDREIEKISHYESELQKCKIDFELKFPKDEKILIQYFLILTAIRDIYYSFRFISNLGKNNNVNRNDILKFCLNPKLCQDDKKMIEIILSLVEDECEQERIKNSLVVFMELKMNIKDYRFWEKISKRCNIK